MTTFKPETISNGYKQATISLCGERFVVIGRNGGATRYFKTLDGARSYARRYVA